jgi:hypothetical protein
MWLAQGARSCCSECGIISLYVRHGDLCPGCGLEFVTAGPVTDTAANWRAVERFGTEHFEVPFQKELEVAQRAHMLPQQRRHWMANIVGLVLVTALALAILWLINGNTNPVSCEGQQSVQLTQAEIDKAGGERMKLTEAVAAEELPSAGYDLYEVARYIDQMNHQLDAAKASPGETITIPDRCYRHSD